jgi:hypothetical protein
MENAKKIKKKFFGGFSAWRMQNFHFSSAGAAGSELQTAFSSDFGP